MVEVVVDELTLMVSNMGEQSVVVSVEVEISGEMWQRKIRLYREVVAGDKNIILYVANPDTLRMSVLNENLYLLPPMADLCGKHISGRDMNHVMRNNCLLPVLLMSLDGKRCHWFWVSGSMVVVVDTGNNCRTIRCLECDVVFSNRVEFTLHCLPTFLQNSMFINSTIMTSILDDGLLASFS